MTIYNSASPYYTTKNDATGLGLMKNRNIPKHADDVQFKINQVYTNRPDLLAHDLYEDSGLWWVFANRNPNTLKDPLFDFKYGTTIFLPKMATLQKVLGV